MPNLGNQPTSAHQRTPQQGNHRSRNNLQTQPRVKKNPKEKANINIASLNMNRATAPSENMSCIDKWAMVNRIIHNERIAILALQETHLDQHLLDQVKNCFGKNLEITNSALPDSPRASAGVAFVINKALIRPKDLDITKLVLGRALMIKLKWLESCETSIINIYAPHNRKEQPNF